MENNIFRDAGTQLDLNGPILSWVQEPTVESLTFDVGLNDLDDVVDVTIATGLTDYYQYPVNDGTVLISAPGANVWAVCDPADTDGVFGTHRVFASIFNNS